MNKYQEALDELSFPLYDSSCGGCKCGTSDCQDCEKAQAVFTLQELVEKATPKKVKEYEDKYYACPICGNPLLHKWEVYPTKLTSRKNGMPVCLNCLQRLDWSEEDE